MAKEDGERGGGFDNFLIYEGLGKREGGLVFYIYIYIYIYIISQCYNCGYVEQVQIVKWYVS